MKSKGTRPSSTQFQPPKPESPPPARRFRIARLEERIAPKRGGKGTHNCSGLTGGCSDMSSISSGSY